MTSLQTSPCDDEHTHQESRQTTLGDDKQYAPQQEETIRLEDFDAMDDGRTSGNDAMTLDITVDSAATEVVAQSLLRDGVLHKPVEGLQIRDTIPDSQRSDGGQLRRAAGQEAHGRGRRAHHDVPGG